MTPPPKLLGRYKTPRFRIGDVVACARRGDVRITGISDAPIPWPIGQTLPKGRARTLVLCGGLAEAVRWESSGAPAGCRVRSRRRDGPHQGSSTAPRASISYSSLR